MAAPTIMWAAAGLVVGVAWLKWRLNGDVASAKYFEGADCTLCKDPTWEVARKKMN